MNKILFITWLSLSLVIGCSNDRVYIVGEDMPNDEIHGGSTFTGVQNTEDLIIYQVNMRTFAESNSFDAVRQRLPQIAALHVNTLWLMPIHDVGILNGINSPYSVKDYFSIKAEYGTPESLRKLIDEAHRLNMAVIFDWVANHTSFDNEWTENKSWYELDDEGNIISPPGTSWTNSAQLNYNNEDMREAMFEAMRYWVIEWGIDGFRCDAADRVPEDFWTSTISRISDEANRKLIWLAEGELKSNFTAGFAMNYGWTFYRKLREVFRDNTSADALFIVHENEYDGVADDKRMLRFTTNHDESAWESTPPVMFGSQEAAMSAYVISAYIGGVPLVYSSQEVGETRNVPFLSSQITDWSKNTDICQEYTDILGLYSEYACLRKGSLTPYKDADIICFTRKYGEETVLVMANTRNRQISFDVPDALRGGNWINAFSSLPESMEATKSFGPYQYIVAVLK